MNIYSLSCCCIYKKKTKKKKGKGKESNTQLSAEYCSVDMRIIHMLWFLEMSIHGESKLTTSCVVLSTSRMSTSNFEYE